MKAPRLRSKSAANHPSPVTPFLNTYRACAAARSDYFMRAVVKENNIQEIGLQDVWRAARRI